MSFKIFLLWTFILIGRPQDFFPFLLPLRPALVFTIITLVATFLSNKKISINDLLKFREGKQYALFYLIMILGIPFAYHRREAFNQIFLHYLANMLFFYIFIIQVDTIKKLKSIFFTICLSAFFYGTFSLTKGSFSHGRFSFGTMYDPNDLAFFLVSLFPLSLFYIAHDEGFYKKLFAITTVGVSIIAILLTGSRGGFVGLVAVSALILFTKIGSVKRLHKIVLLTAITIIIIFYGYNINTERFLSLLEIGSDYNVTDEFGRLEVWDKAIQLILLNPVTGVGVNCFTMAIGYAREAAGEIPRWQAAHNSFLQIATEVGLIGFILFVSIIFSCLKNFSHCKKLEASSVEIDELKTIAGFLKIGFIGCLTTAFFLTHGYSILLTLFFAFSAILRKLQNNLHSDNAI